MESTRPGGHWGYKQGAFLANLDRPGRTVTASAQQDWILDPQLGIRRLSPRECAAIQGFPADWTFAGRRADQYRLVGNAVPPRLAFRLGQSLLRHVDGTAEAVAQRQCHSALQALPHRLQAAIHYTMREQAANGASRLAAGSKRRSTAVRVRA